MRVLMAAAAAAAMLVSSALAGEAVDGNMGPLAPGKPAGVKKAQDQDNAVLYLVGGGLVIAGIVLVATADGEKVPTPATTTTSSTTP